VSETSGTSLNNIISPASVCLYAFISLFVPAVGELTVLAYPRLSLLMILLSAATGRFFATGLLCVVYACGLQHLTDRFMKLSLMRASWFSRAVAFVSRHGIWGLALLGCIPGAPFRSPLHTVLLSKPRYALLLPVFVVALTVRDIVIWTLVFYISHAIGG
jgi:hypothetical protein